MSAEDCGQYRREQIDMQGAIEYLQRSKLCYVANCKSMRETYDSASVITAAFCLSACCNQEAYGGLSFMHGMCASKFQPRAVNKVDKCTWALVGNSCRPKQ